jgi:hypothetical protein
MAIAIPDTMVHNGQIVNIVPSCPHLDGTWRDDKPVSPKHHDKEVRLKDFGNSRIIVATRNLTNGITDPEVLKSMRVLSLKELYRSAKK